MERIARRPDAEGRVLGEDQAEAFYNEFRRSAYQEADIDTIRMVRELAENGALG